MKNASVSYVFYAVLLGLATVGLRVLLDRSGLSPLLASALVAATVLLLLTAVTRVGEGDRRTLILPNLATCACVALVALGRLSGYPLVGVCGILVAIGYAVHSLTTNLDDRVSLWVVVGTNCTQAMYVAHWLFVS